MANAGRAASRPGQVPRLVRAAVCLASAVSVIGWLLVAALNDASPFGMLLGFAPRWWVVFPWILLLPLGALAGLPTALVAVGGTLAAVFGIARFELPRGTPAAPPRALRVVTYNTDFSLPLTLRLRSDLRRWDADIVLLQDCQVVLAQTLRLAVPEAGSLGPYCFASRWPIVEAVPLTPPESRGTTTSPSAIRLRIRTPSGELLVYAVHLPSPRHALGAARWPQPGELIPRLRASLEERGRASAFVSSVVARRNQPFIVAGDFNLPYGSAILRRDWSDLTNAFAAVGMGFGHTMQAGIFPVRIDHVLVPSTLRPVAATVLSGYPSEHQPVVVDLAWPD
jgi:endonuclease/exonuclease/phosphatase (EEP) superfamily protein YafD